jgi:hypothetical protein
MLLRLNQNSMYPEHHLLVLSIPTERFQLGITLMSPQWVFSSNTWLYTPLSSCLFADTACSCHCLWRWWKDTLYSVVWLLVLFLMHALPLPWSPSSPLHEVIAEDESRGCTGETPGPLRLHQASSRLHQLYFTLDTCNDRENSGQETDTYTNCSSHSFLHTYT